MKSSVVKLIIIIIIKIKIIIIMMTTNLRLVVHTAAHLLTASAASMKSRVAKLQ